MQHLGSGRRWIHDSGADKQVRHGLRRRYQAKSPRVLEFIEHHASDPAPLDLSEELALTRSLLSEWLEREGTDEPVGMKLVEKVTQIVERIERINAKNIAYGELRRFLFMVRQVLELRVPDEETRKLIFAELVSLRVPL